MRRRRLQRSGVRRLEGVEGHFRLFSGCRYAEEFIARRPHVTRLLPSVR